MRDYEILKRGFLCPSLFLTVPHSHPHSRSPLIFFYLFILAPLPSCIKNHSSRVWQDEAVWWNQPGNCTMSERASDSRCTHQLASAAFAFLPVAVSRDRSHRVHRATRAVGCSRDRRLHREPQSRFTYDSYRSGRGRIIRHVGVSSESSGLHTILSRASIISSPDARASCCDRGSRMLERVRTRKR